MQLYHHPYSLDSQKVRLVLEEKDIDYTSFHVNPITGKNFDSGFFRKNPTAKLPVFQNGSHILYDTVEIIQYIERIAMVSSGGDESSLSSGEVVEWIYKIQQWNPKFFTLSHVLPKYRLTVSKFLRRVIIARMAECPELASAYHLKLKEAYQTEDKLKDPEAQRRSEEHLERILDEAETKLSETTAYLLGGEFTLADVAFIPVLSRLALLNMEEKYIATRPNVAEYWNRVQKRPSYKKVIGKHFDGWRRHKTLFRTWCFVQIRSLLKQY
ncbi:Glutathione S-transferase family protein [Perilla frutescens var. hirtella]|uniref:Glutathione S-transferase family protein n=1 Tax=Perilla frutescens var. hirtella TaxID=608512 RepID=A0AAD4PB89_PERFH|nr:Glutathione S-transferase family protein [Perilla frutescens var. frutescens]KAH6800029.1 Glutathione S-transferase family protein [Perilla frutescens var. hirtella]KAH6832765.1 Glutathione S-transferase family protein [Perilla frutescens var. hirtella]